MSLGQLETVAPAAFRDAISQHAAGVAVVTSVDGSAPVGMTVSTFASHSVDPPTVSCDLAVTSATLAAIRDARRFAVHLLDARQEELALRFASSRVNRFADTRWSWADGLPALDGVLARFACTLLADVEVGDHVVVLGTVTEATADPARTPLIHQDRRFRRLHLA
jgi:flavin reductase (DIM6/NTAB) family NADH-FMN oxidoreductase RutF